MKQWCLIIFVLVLLLMPLAGVSAQESQFVGDIAPFGIVPCGDAGEPPCDACQLAALAQDIINFGVYFVVIVATLVIVWAGFLYISAQGDPGKIETAHKVFQTVIIGLIIVLAAWLFINLLLQSFASRDLVGGQEPSLENILPWAPVQCEAARRQAEAERVAPSSNDLQAVDPSGGQVAPVLDFTAGEVESEIGRLLGDSCFTSTGCSIEVGESDTLVGTMVPQSALGSDEIFAIQTTSLGVDELRDAAQSSCNTAGGFFGESGSRFVCTTEAPSHSSQTETSSQVRYCYQARPLGTSGTVERCFSAQAAEDAVQLCNASRDSSSQLYAPGFTTACAPQ